MLLVSEIRLTQQDKHCTITWVARVIEAERVVAGRDRGDKEIRSYSVIDIEFQIGKKKKFWIWLGMMVAQQCECAQWQWIVYLKVAKMANVMYILI